MRQHESETISGATPRHVDVDHQVLALFESPMDKSCGLKVAVTTAPLRVQTDEQEAHCPQQECNDD